MIDVKTVVSRLIEKTQEDLIEWHGVADGRGCSDGHEAKHQDTTFVLDGQDRFRINDVFFLSDDPQLAELRKAIHSYQGRRNAKAEADRKDGALSRAASVLGL